MQNALLTLVKSLIALFATWAIALMPFALPFYYDQTNASDLLYFIELTGELVLAGWLFVAVPLLIFLRPASPFWRYYVSLPVGLVVGSIMSCAFLHALSTGKYPDIDDMPFLSTVLSGIASGTTMFGLISWMNWREVALEDRLKDFPYS